MGSVNGHIESAKQMADLLTKTLQMAHAEADHPALEILLLDYLKTAVEMGAKINYLHNRMNGR